MEATQSQSIRNLEDWNVFLSLLGKYDLLPPADIALIDQTKPTFPASFEAAISTVACLAKNMDHNEILECILTLDAKINQFRDTIEVWNLHSLPQQELAQLLYKLSQAYTECSKTREELQRVQDKMNSYSEDVQRLVYENVHDKATGVITARTYQDEEQLALEKMWHSEKVRAVQYRNRAPRALKEFENGVVRQLGYCARRNTPVDVMKVPHELTDYPFLTSFFNQISAQKQLFFSKYFPHYLGFDDLTEPNHNLYFFDLMKGVSLGKVFEGRTIADKSALLRHWARELLCAFSDLLHKTTHGLATPVTLNNVFIQDDGVKVFLKNVEFGEELEDSAHDQKEAELLHMYSLIMYHLLTGQPTKGDLFSLPVHHQLKCIIEEAYQCLQAFKDKGPQTEVMAPKLESTGFVSEGLTFMRLHTHPFFSLTMDEFNFDKILDEYELLFPKPA